MKKIFLSFLIFFIYHFDSKFHADYEFANKKELFRYFDDVILILIFGFLSNNSRFNIRNQRVLDPQNYQYDPQND